MIIKEKISDLQRINTLKNITKKTTITSTSKNAILVIEAATENLELKLLVGSFAQKWHLDTNLTVTNVVKDWRLYAPEFLPLPHPSWRNRAWLKKNFWFEKELVPVLRNKVRGILKNETAK